MIKINIIIACLTCCLVKYSYAEELISPDTVIVSSGKLMLKGLLWRPVGNGLFPTIIFCHGSYETNDNDTRYDVIQQTSVLGPLFAKQGYLFLVLFRRGIGISKDQGENSADLMANAFKEKGQEERNKVQMRLLDTDDLQDIISGLTFLRQRNDVDAYHIAIIGHSFGGSLALIAAEHEPDLKAVVIFGAAGYSWNISPQLRTRLFNAIENINAPVMIVQAQNDYSVNPG